MSLIPLASIVATLLLWLGHATSALAQTDEIQVYDAAIAPTGAFNLTRCTIILRRAATRSRVSRAASSPTTRSTVSSNGRTASRHGSRGACTFRYIRSRAMAALYITVLSFAPSSSHRMRSNANSSTASISNSASTPRTGMREPTHLKFVASWVLMLAALISSSIRSWIIPGTASPSSKSSPKRGSRWRYQRNAKWHSRSTMTLAASVTSFPPRSNLTNYLLSSISTPK
jgi:hypothetical protein